ncbi:hypothetical protein B0919_18010 [Hymenobacter sp. CRA2]|nr:hypothetical protein B0919_18010 [Hymenobacter sp. CRA2]
MATPFAASAQRVLWAEAKTEQLPAAARRTIQALDRYRVVSIQAANLRAALQQAPAEAGAGARRSATVISLPLPDGTSARFRVVETAIMAPGLAARYPMIKTYAAQGIDDPTATAYLDLSPAGLHVMILSATNTVFVDPTADGTNHLVFYKRDINQSAVMRGVCGVQAASTMGQRLAPKESTPLASRPNGTQLRTYRMAMACTGEYAATKGGTVAGALAGIVASVNRVSGVYTTELAIRLQLISNTDQLIFLDAANDPYTNVSNGATLNTNQQIVDTRIGAANYDIGHVFNTDGGGVAGLGVVCVAGNKARGTTGLPNPTGDAFDIDFVAHEVGHQFGASHTFNSSTDGNCSGGNRTASAAYEPGSGSTIMAYASICAPSNLQMFSDPYFHTKSYDDILNHINGNGACAVLTPTNNGVPTVDAGVRRVIPKGTPFELTGSGSDPDGDALTYCWEQFDLGPGGPPNSPSGDAPIFRSFNPTTSPSRVFPRLSNLLSNTSTIGEILPSYGRTLHFRLTARDNRVSGGAVEYDTVSVPVIGTAGPFVVTAPNTNVTWRATVPQQVTWDVANTTAAPISAANVDILLSTDGGQTFPYTLAAGTPNDGSQTVTVPATVPASTQARIKVKASGNVFFDLSNVNFALQVPTTPGFYLTSDCSSTPPAFCPGSSATCTLQVGQLLGFTGQVALSASNLPAGVTATFASTSVAAGASTSITLTATRTTTSGTYTFNVLGSNGNQQESQPVTIIIRNAAFVPPTPILPAANSVRALALPTFQWSAIQAATSYDLQVATDAAFTNLVINQTGVSTNSYTSTVTLTSNGRYFWRVRGIADCGTGDWSASQSFYVGRTACTTYASTNVPVNIASTGSAVALSTLTLNGVGTISDLRLRNLNITHPNVGELIIALIGPTGRRITVMSVPCDGTANVNANFSDAGNAITCPINTGGTYQPLNPFSTFRGLSADGQWTLLIQDVVTGNGGDLTSWGLEVCTVQDAVTSARDVQKLQGVSVFPNPSTGLFELQVDNGVRGTLQVRVTDAVGRVVMTKQLNKGAGLLHDGLDLSKLSRGMYQLHLELPGGGVSVEKLMKL